MLEGSCNGFGGSSVAFGRLEFLWGREEAVFLVFSVMGFGGDRIFCKQSQRLYFVDYDNFQLAKNQSYLNQIIAPEKHSIEPTNI